MDADSKTIAQETFDHLPQDIKETIFADDYQTILADTGKKFNLTPEQQSKFEFETTMVLMGLNKRAYYQFDLELALGIEEETAESIAKEIDSTVFATVSDSLEQIEKEMIGDDKELDARLDYEEKRLEAQNPPEGEDKPLDTSLTSLADRLKQASIATPIRRDYSLNASTTKAPAVETRAAIDPYHEAIDNE